MDIEGELIAAALQSETAMNLVIERRVTVDFFDDPSHKRVWEYVLQHYTTYGAAPTADVVRNAYPAYRLAVPEQPVGYYTDQLGARRREVILLDGIKDAMALREAQEPGTASEMAKVLSASLDQANVETAALRTTTYPPTLRNRLKAWKRGGGSGFGISYGFPTLDQHTNGMHPEQFVIFTGLPKSRKSWTLLHVASTVHALDFPVMYVTFEMSNDEQLERLATLWGKIPTWAMRDKTLLTEKHFRSLGRMLNVRDQLAPFVGIEDAFGNSTVSALMALAREANVAVLCIDGIYLMTDERTGMAGFEGHAPLTNISRDLKRIAKSNGITIVATTQTLHSKTKQGKTNLHGMGYTSAFAQDTDLSVGVEVDDTMSDYTTMRILGNRNGRQGIEFMVKWDLDNGLIEELGESEFTGGSSGGSPPGEGEDDGEVD